MQNKKIVVLSFGHPISGTVRRDIEASWNPDREYEYKTIEFGLNMSSPMRPQVEKCLNCLPVETWSAEEVLLILPGVSVASVLVVDGVALRMGRMPRVVEVSKHNNGNGRLIWRVKQIHSLSGLPKSRKEEEKKSWVRKMLGI